MHKEEKKQEEQELQVSAAALPVLTLSQEEHPQPQINPAPQDIPLKESIDKGTPKVPSAPEEEIQREENPKEETNTKKEPLKVTPEIQKQFRAFRDDVIKIGLKNAYSLPISFSYQGKEDDLKNL